MFDVAKRCSQRCSTVRGTRKEARLKKRVVSQETPSIYSSPLITTAQPRTAQEAGSEIQGRLAPSDMRAKGEAQKDVTVENPNGDGGVKAAGDAAARSCRGGAGEASFSSLISA